MRDERLYCDEHECASSKYKMFDVKQKVTTNDLPSAVIVEQTVHRWTQATLKDENDGSLPRCRRRQALF
uniref:Transposase n=1 Tax=Heterorhabditis bacteriophora TaxID=37862 RepID=A0A1I7XCA2_HETBA